jgi:hypothetical protein
MTATGFWVDRESPGISDLIRQVRAPNGMQFSEGDACYISTSTTTSGPNTTYDAGLLIQADAQTSPVRYTFLAMVSDKSYLRPATFNLISSAFEMCEVIECSEAYAAHAITLNTQFALATIDGTAANANSTTNNVLVTAAGSTNDYNGGQLYVNETGQQYTIINDTVGAGVHTFTIAPAPAVAITTGNTVRVVPWGPGYVGGVKLQSSNPQQGISVAVADKTGGPLFIWGVDLATRTAYVRFAPFLIAK